jgi:hypothetical protein
LLRVSGEYRPAQHKHRQRAPVSDTGNFQYYAGPVSAAAPKTCVKWGGSINGIAFESGFSHCG